MAAGLFHFGPGNYIGNVAATASSTGTMSAIGHRNAWIFTAPKSGTLSTIKIRVTTKSGASRGWTAGFYTLSAAGKPTTTLFGASAAVTQTITGTGVWTFTPSTGAAVNQGDQLCVVFNNDGVAFAGESIAINRGRFDNSGGFDIVVPSAWSSTDSGATWTNQSIFPGIGLEYSDGDIVFAANQTSPAGLSSTTEYNSASTPDERGAAFVPEWNMTVVGVRGQIQKGGVDQLWTMKLYDTDGTTALATVPFYENQAISSLTQARDIWFLFAPVTLLAGRTYYIGVTTDAAAADGIFFPFYTQLDDATHRGAFPYSDALNWQYATRTDAGAWTLDNTKIPHLVIAATAVY